MKLSTKTFLATLFAIALAGATSAFADNHNKCDGECKGKAECSCSDCKCENDKECNCEKSCKGAACAEHNKEHHGHDKK